ncbi:hypothetical protein [Kineosporia babensis]|uniref:Uncharacterized protein n=1 Tax=Kineosporia babensis TaxID=499548 RepID=A0A9X1NGG3_9ACTN|nr:hypothetical protein [Kineosporia babensis]MCD5312846.1 hypothetical protein [Kineosporia babensis]
MRSRYPVLAHRELRPWVRPGAALQLLSPLQRPPEATFVERDRDGEHHELTHAQPFRRRSAAITMVDVRENVDLSLKHVLSQFGRRPAASVIVHLRCAVPDPVALVTACHRSLGMDLPRHLTGVLRSVAPLGETADWMAVYRNLNQRLRPWPEEYAVPGMRIELIPLVSEVRRLVVEPGRRPDQWNQGEAAGSDDSDDSDDDSGDDGD